MRVRISKPLKQKHKPQTFIAAKEVTVKKELAFGVWNKMKNTVLSLGEGGGQPYLALEEYCLTLMEAREPDFHVK